MVDVLWILRHKVLRRTHYEQPVMDRLKRVRGEIFVDIGANIGRYSKNLARNFTIVHAFEPNPRYFEKLIHNTALIGNVDVRTSALADFDGETRLFLGSTGYSGSADTILKEFRYNPADNPRAATLFKGSEDESVVVNCFRFDTLFPKETMDLVKVDVEGAEFLVLQGMASALKEQRIKNLVVELHDASQTENLQNLLRGLGYWSVWLDPTHLHSWPSRL